MADKKFTPKEAAVAVLQKAEQLYKSSNLAKGDWAKIHSKLKREGYSEESADKIDGAIKAKMGKSEELKKGDMPMSSPSPAPTPMPTINQQIGSPFGKSEAPMKGHIKLAKFMGAMEAKRGQRPGAMDKAETGHEEGVNTQSMKAGPGISKMGQAVRSSVGAAGGDYPGVTQQGAMDKAKSIVKEKMNQNRQIKPKLPG